MNELKTNGNGGFPLNLDDIRFLDKSYREVFKGLLSPLDTVSNRCIILSGLQRVTSFNSSTYSEGYVVLDGELCYFPEQTIPTNIALGTTVLIAIDSNYHINGLKIFQNGTTVNTYEVRRAILSIGSPSPNIISFNSAKSYYDVLNSKLDIVPVGVIVMWSGSITSIPAGYLLCDGANGTPNLKGRFVVGYNASDVDYDAIGKVGGEKEHQLTESEMPSHIHRETINGPVAGTGINSGTSFGLTTSGYDTSSTGGDEAHENRPPYYTLAYIIKI